MQKIFDVLIDTYINHKIGCVDNFLQPVLAQSLKADLIAHLHADKFKSAGIGDTAHVLHNQTIRTDSIYWLDRLHKNIHENNFFDIIDKLVNYLNTTCYTGIQSYEFHYTQYAIGSFYKRHIDQFKTNADRAFSMIIYLNENWLAGDGGELCIYNNSATQLITPTSGKCVFFKSNELEHEVLQTYQPRYSITGWFKTSTTNS